uniref:Uncharacterized protein n=1 Tax=Spermophilus dauricus TaxID=99837 RepID=A0A8C9PYM7_SPEDA
LLTLCLEIMIYVYFCCLLHSLQIILQLAVGCLIAICSLPPSSAQVRRINEDQKIICEMWIPEKFYKPLILCCGSCPFL